MTIASTTSKILYNGDGATTVFAINFVFWRNRDIRVIHRDASGAETAWIEDTHYTVTGGAGAAGTLTVITAPTDYTPAAGEILLIKSALTETQDAALPLGGAFPSTVVERMADILTRLVQQHSEEITRSILLPESTSLSGMRLPEPGAGELVRYNADGTGLETVALADLGTSIDTVLSGRTNGDTLVYDAAAAVWVSRGSGFAPAQQATPNMTVRVAAGSLFDAVGKVRVTRAAQTSATIAPPVADPRNDIVHIDRATGVLGVATGSEAAQPSDPTIPDDTLPVARLRLVPSITEITDSAIDDVRELGLLGAGRLARRDTVDGPSIAMGGDARGDILYHDGTAYARLPAGMPGHFLKTRGGGADPVWASADTMNVQTFTVSGTWARPSGVTWVLVRLWGAGGSGGAISTYNAAGGGGGGYGEWLVPASVLGATEAVSIGAGGAGVAGGNGIAGGTTTFGPFAAYGGGGGALGDPNSPGGGGGGTGSAGRTAASGVAGGGTDEGGAASGRFCGANGGDGGNANPGGNGFYGGGGGGACGAQAAGGVGGNSVFGGAGGGASANGLRPAGGTSRYGGSGGSGGQAGDVNGEAGSQPGGGGGAAWVGGTSGSGGDGKAEITAW